MNKRYIAFFSLIIILAFISYIIYDTLTSGTDSEPDTQKATAVDIPDLWRISKEILSTDGALSSVTVSNNGNFFLGGDRYISCYNSGMEKVWTTATPGTITSLSVSGDTVFAGTAKLLLLYSQKGIYIDTWGPFEDKSFITSVTSNKSFVAFADAGNKSVFVLTKDGRVKSMIGQTSDKFIIPSPYFEVALDENNSLYISNTGTFSIEKRSFDGDLINRFGFPGTAPDAFCGCCNPAHFALIPGGFITSEKGINRIKILDKNGDFVEFISSKNNFTRSVPLDVASADGKTIYAANQADSKLYIFTRK